MELDEKLKSHLQELEIRTAHTNTADYELKLKIQDLDRVQAQLLQLKLDNNELVKKHMKSDDACEKKDLQIKSLREQLENYTANSTLKIREQEKEIEQFKVLRDNQLSEIKLITSKLQALQQTARARR